MASELIMMCRHADKFAAIRITRGQDFGTLVQKICERWSDLDPESVIMNYSLVGEEDMILDNDDDMVTMFGLAQSRGLEDIMVNVKDGAKDFTNDTIEVGNKKSDIASSSKGKQVIVYEDEDVIPQFCSHKKVKLLTSDWSEGITTVGQIFEGGALEFKSVLRKYAIERGCEYALAKNDKVRVTAQCKYRADKGCMWYVHARICPGNEYFYIKGMDLVHICGVAVRTLNNPHATAKLVTNLVGDDVRAKHQTRPVDVVKVIKKNYGLNISYHQAWWGIEKARGQVFGDYVKSFSSLKWYIGATKSVNPGSHIELESNDETKRFKRVFVAFGACLNGFNHCRPLIFLDAAHLKGRYRGTILGATGKNGNQGIYPICFAVVDSETYENWRWFLEHLRLVLAPGRNITFISDRHMGLLMARRDIFPESGHGYCLLHLKRNLRDHLKGTTRAHRERMVSLFVCCAYAPTREIFHQTMSSLVSSGGYRVNEFLTNLHYENWSNAFFRGQRYGEMTSNVAESFNSWIEEERHLPITTLVDALRLKIMNMLSERRDQSRKWVGKVCPEMDKRLRASFNESRTWVVSAAGDGVHEVHSFPNVTVDINRRICSCQSWQLTGFPCAHSVVVLASCGKDITDYVDPYYFTQTFCAAYSYSIQPIPTVWMPERPIEEDFLLPPLCKKPPGRPRNKRIPSRGENVSLIRCGRCHKMGKHNRKSCKEAM
ncbi:hypothetical protein RHGRI_022909 [Rhododendron griersonianum]|uniref:SWIM-type domain-containing protein n=1 Tax=Rhododendron griersonianum TaxID=479676 RepID=A0AAV6J3K9_9ERIC|nr:hypothetical protein RHGRI_022909 [Rhododendron griersonianum]